MKRKFLCLIVITITLIGLLSGCRKQPKGVHWWHHSYNGKITRIIYEVKSEATDIIDNELLWDIDNVQLNLYFGWDAKRKKDYYNDYAIIHGGYELVCFAAYFFWTKPTYNSYFSEDFNDYKNPPDAFFLKEYSIEDFLSKKYEANYGERAGFLRSHPPVFNELHEPLKVTVHQEVFQISEERKPYARVYEFRFGVTPVFYHRSKNAYYFGASAFGESVDGLTFGYEYYDSGKISIGPH